jgi:hypothetical protein
MKRTRSDPDQTRNHETHERHEKKRARCAAPFHRSYLEEGFMSARPRPPAVEIMRNLGLEPDPWQIRVLKLPVRQMLLNCCRQAGKSTTVALLALVEAIFVPGTKVLLVSRSLRQSQELFRIVSDFYRRLGSPMLKRLTREELLMTNLSRIVCLPCREDTIRGYSNVGILILDEASRVPDDLYRAVRPMLAVSNGRMICLTTPHGKRGFFYEAWTRGGDDWARIEVPATQVPRIKPEFLDQERREMGDAVFRREYECSFESLEGLVYPDFGRCVVAALPPHVSEKPVYPQGKRYGGIDFGFRNPFAAIWGTLDRDGVLWLTGEHYARQKPLSEHARHLPRDVTWYADPSGAGDIAELRAASFAVRKGNNDLCSGIAAVTARLRDGRLHVLAGRCPNLLAEAELYRYSEEPDERGSEAPVDEYNHALAALRYLIRRLDERRLARRRPGQPPDGGPEGEAPPARKPWLRLDNPRLWPPFVDPPRFMR